MLNYVIFRFLFSLNIILFFSCVPSHLGVIHNHKKNQPTPESHLGAFLKFFKLASTTGADQKDIKEIIEKVKSRFAASKDDMGSIMEPFFGREGISHSITPVTKLTDYPKDKRESLLNLVKDIVIINSHLYLGMQELSMYVDNKESVNHGFVKKILQG